MSSISFPLASLLLGIVWACVFLWLAVEAPLTSVLFSKPNNNNPDRRNDKLILTFAIHPLGASLVGAALVYVLFALIWGTSYADVRLELIGVAVYSLFYGAAVLRQNALWLSAGWILHPLWDVLLHLKEGSPGKHLAPEWYVWACISFDFVVCIYIARRMPSWSKSLSGSSSAGNDKSLMGKSQ